MIHFQSHVRKFSQSGHMPLSPSLQWHFPDYWHVHDIHECWDNNEDLLLIICWCCIVKYGCQKTVNVLSKNVDFRLIWYQLHEINLKLTWKCLTKSEVEVSNTSRRSGDVHMYVMEFVLILNAFELLIVYWHEWKNNEMLKVYNEIFISKTLF